MIYLAHQIALYHGVQETHLHTLQIIQISIEQLQLIQDYFMRLTT